MSSNSNVSITILGNARVVFTTVPDDERAVRFLQFRHTRLLSEYNSKTNQLCCLIVLGILLAASAAVGSYAVAKYVGTTNPLIGTIAGFAAATIIYIVVIVRHHRTRKLLAEEEDESGSDDELLKQSKCIRAKPLVEFLLSRNVHDNSKIELLYNIDISLVKFAERLNNYLNALIDRGMSLEMGSLSWTPRGIQGYKHNFIDEMIRHVKTQSSERDSFLKEIASKRKEADDFEKDLLKRLGQVNYSAIAKPA